MFGFGRKKSRYNEEHYADFSRAMKEVRDWMMENPDANSRFSLAMFLAAMADTFEMDSPDFDRLRMAKACGFPCGGYK